MLLALQLTPAQSVVPDGPDGAAVAAADMVAGIISYTRWPDNDGPVRLCVGGASPLAARMVDRTLLNGRRVTVSRTESPAAPTSNCDALFVGRSAAGDLPRIARAVQGRPVLTITDGDAACTSGIMACLRMTPAGLTFDLNLDAVSRGTVRIDPRVLSLGRRNAP